MRKYIRINGILVIFLACIMVFSGCCGKNPYNAKIDSMVTSMKTDLDNFLSRMETSAGTPEGEYVNNVGFYEDIDKRLKELIALAESTPHNHTIVDMINKDAQDIIGKLRERHKLQKEKGLSSFYIKQTKGAIDRLLNGIKEQEEKWKNQKQGN